MEGTSVPDENHQLISSHWQLLFKPWQGFEPCPWWGKLSNFCLHHSAIRAGPSHISDIVNCSWKGMIASYDSKLKYLYLVFGWAEITSANARLSTPWDDELWLTFFISVFSLFAAFIGRALEYWNNNLQNIEARSGARCTTMLLIKGMLWLTNWRFYTAML